MSQLSSMLEELRKSKGIAYSERYHVLQTYIKRMEDSSFERQLKDVDSKRDLGYLLSLGLSFYQQALLIDKGRELK